MVRMSTEGSWVQTKKSYLEAIDRWISENRMSYDDFSLRIGCGRSFLHGLFHQARMGHYRRIRSMTEREIAKVTGIRASGVTLDSAHANPCVGWKSQTVPVPTKVIEGVMRAADKEKIGTGKWLHKAGVTSGFTKERFRKWTPGTTIRMMPETLEKIERHLTELEKNPASEPLPVQTSIIDEPAALPPVLQEQSPMPVDDISERLSLRLFASISVRVPEETYHKVEHLKTQYGTTTAAIIAAINLLSEVRESVIPNEKKSGAAV